jgi:hypothetical protein
MLLRERACRCVEGTDELGCGEIGNMDDQRVEAWSSLGLVDTRDRLGIGCVGGEAVDRLGRDSDRLARKDQPRGVGDTRVGEGEDPRLAFR